jgi:hypothetical protein
MATQTPATAAATAHGLIVSLSAVDPRYYVTWKGQLDAADVDAETMGALLTRAGIPTRRLANRAATRDGLVAAFDTLVANAKANDLVVIYYSGHGTQLKDQNGDEPYDDCWCLYDGMFTDDEISEQLVRFGDGISVVVIIESCFSGSGISLFGLSDSSSRRDWSRSTIATSLAWTGVGEVAYNAQSKFYDEILSRKYVSCDNASASILQISACGDDEYAFCDERGGSLFTNALAAAFRADPTLTYEGLIDRVVDAVENAEKPASQRPRRLYKGQTLKNPIGQRRAFQA